MDSRRTLGGKYRLERSISAGGMAEVFLATLLGAEGFERRVVLKRILPHLASDPKFVRYFIDEAKTAALLTHENVVRVFDFFSEDNELALVMEYVEGCDLAQLSNLAFSAGRPIPLGVALLIGRKLLRGLAYAHSRADERGEPLAIVHRDVTPRNVLIGRSGEVKVADFGIARSRSLHSATQAGALRGKLSYMSPEQARGEQVDQRSDVYSAALLIWELLSGVRAFDALSELELLELVREPLLPSIAMLRPDLPEAAARVLTRALSPDRALRQADAGDLERELGAAGISADDADLAQYVTQLLDAGPAPEVQGRRTATLVGREVSGAITPPQQQGPAARPARWLRRGAVGAALLSLIALVTWIALRPEPPAPVQPAAPAYWIAAEQAALLNVRTDPPGALVLLDNQPLGIAPLSGLAVRPGKRLTVEALKPGRLPERRRINLSAGKTRTLSLKLPGTGVDFYYPNDYSISDDIKETMP